MTTTARRWIGMLCIALLALVVVGHVDVTSAGTLDQVAYAEAATTGDQGESNENFPEAPGHCCCAHPVSTDAADHITLSSYSAGPVMPLSDDGAPTGVRDGPERPPRTTAS